ILLLGFTLLRPEVVQTLQRTERPEIAVLLDRSGSMDTPDVADGTNLIARAEWLNARAAEPAWNPLAASARVMIEEFGTGGPGGQTDLGAALEGALRRAQNLKAVLLLTDGDWNTGTPPTSAALRYREQGIPVFSVGIGRDTPLP